MEPLSEPLVRVDSWLSEDDERSLANDVLDGLTKPFKELPAKHFYDAWLGLIAYAFQIYLDFAGYSDMAVGLITTFGRHYEQLLIVADPLFLKRLLDHAREAGLDWSQFVVHVVIGEEIFGERFRAYGPLKAQRAFGDRYSISARPLMNGSNASFGSGSAMARARQVHRRTSRVCGKR